ncbi:ATP-binding cassette domain-containing protein [bacterium SCSIO 12741]|nr:ATP-binding cassette domain-containing protein [bacterium SCSIO 12741]
MLKLQNVSVGYGDEAILRSINLEASPGEVIGILGRNGSGKTTLFRTLSGWLKPMSGDAYFQGEALNRSQVAFLEAEPSFYRFMKGSEYLELINGGKDRLAEWGQALDLPLDRFADEYSTGMKKKLAVAGTFIQERPIMLLDEPFTGVDLESNEKIYAIIQHYAKDRVVLLSSHLLATLTEIADRIVWLDNGEIKEVYDKGSFDALKASFRESAIRGLDGLLG